MHNAVCQNWQKFQWWICFMPCIWILCFFQIVYLTYEWKIPQRVFSRFKNFHTHCGYFIQRTVSDISVWRDYEFPWMLNFTERWFKYIDLIIIFICVYLIEHQATGSFSILCFCIGCVIFHFCTGYKVWDQLLCDRELAFKLRIIMQHVIRYFERIFYLVFRIRYDFYVIIHYSV